MTEPLFGIVANVASDRVFRTGAKVWLLGVNGDAECPVAFGVSKGGRLVQKYTHFKRLTNFRGAWMPEHIRARRRNFGFHTREEADAVASRLAKMWRGVAYRHRDGTLLADGVSISEAFRRLD